jgi:acyl-coenzyme A thioesterase PaaI-like protein
MTEDKKDLKKARRLMWLFTVFKIPLMGYVKPRLISINPQKAVFLIKLRRRTRNHLGSMYFGSLAVGADLAGGFHAFYLSDKMKKKISLVFKNFEADFIRRPDSDVYFVSEDGDLVQQMIDQTIASKERVTKSISIDAYTNYFTNPEKVAAFKLGLSLKDKL